MLQLLTILAYGAIGTILYCVNTPVWALIVIGLLILAIDILTFIETSR